MERRASPRAGRARCSSLSIPQRTVQGGGPVNPQVIPLAADYIRILPEIVLSIFGMVNHGARSADGRGEEPENAGRASDSRAC